MAQAPDVMVGIAGPSCAGKSTLERHLQQAIGDELVTFPFDDMFVGLEAVADKDINDWESPGLYRWDDYETHIEALKQGRATAVQANSRESMEAGIDRRVIVPKPVVVVIGFLALHSAVANQHFDTKLYIDLPEPEIVRRRLVRSNPDHPWDKPEYITAGLAAGTRRHVEPQRQIADHVIDGQLPPLELAGSVLHIINELKHLEQ